MVALARDLAAAVTAQGARHRPRGDRRGIRLPRLARGQPLHVPRLPRVPPRARPSRRPSRAGRQVGPRAAAHGRRSATAEAHASCAARCDARRARRSLLVVTKANSISTVHRATYLDYVGVKRSTTAAGDRGASLHRPVHVRHVQREPALDSAAAPQGAARHRPLRHLAGEPRRQGTDARARDSPPRRAVPGQRRRAGALVPRHRQPLRAPARAPAAASRPLPAVLLVPAVRAARPLQHPGSRAHRADPDRGTRRRRARVAGDRSRSRHWRDCTSWCARIRTGRSTPTSSASRRASPRRCARGRIGCARSSSPPARRAGRGIRAALRRCLSGLLPGRRAGRAGHSRPARASRACPTRPTRSDSHCSAAARAARCCTCACTGAAQPIAMSDLLPLLENFDLRVINERPYRSRRRRHTSSGSRTSR